LGSQIGHFGGSQIEIWGPRFDDFGPPGVRFGPQGVQFGSEGSSFGEGLRLFGSLELGPVQSTGWVGLRGSNFGPRRGSWDPKFDSIESRKDAKKLKLSIRIKSQMAI
jgi:hypothetical protein